MNIREKIEKKEKEINLLQEKIRNKKTELKVLRKKKEDQEQIARARRNEQVIHKLEVRLGGNFSLEELELFLQELPEDFHIQPPTENGDDEGDAYESH